VFFTEAIETGMAIPVPGRYQAAIHANQYRNQFFGEWFGINAIKTIL
jgi:hypothetical protein